MRLFPVLLVLATIYGCDTNGAGRVDRNSSEISNAISQGAPSIYREWLPVDYVNYDSYLSKIDSNSYPRYRDGALSDLFKKYVDSFHQTIFKNESIPIDSRIKLSLDMSSAIKNTLKSYYVALSEGKPYSHEACYIMGGMLVNTNEILELADEFRANLDPSDPSYAVRLDALERMKYSSANVLLGAIVSLSERSMYAANDREVLARYISSEAPSIMMRLNDDTKNELGFRISGVIKEEKETSIRELLSIVM